MKIEFSGRVWKMGADIDTDIITGSGSEAEKLVNDVPRADIQGRKIATFGLYRPEFGTQAKEGDIIVADKNFGCGSSREFAPAMIKACGIRAIIAPSFARIFYRNALNNGIYLLECPEAPDICEDGDIITVRVNECVVAGGKEYPVPHIPENLMAIIEEGGLLEHFRKMNGKGGANNGQNAD